MVAFAGMPAMAPGEPTLPLIVDTAPPAVTPEPPTIAKLCALPIVCAKTGEEPHTRTATPTSAAWTLGRTMTPTFQLAVEHIEADGFSLCRIAPVPYGTDAPQWVRNDS